jgi:5,5'-dehydrodivanillate O-demethylase
MLRQAAPKRLVLGFASQIAKPGDTLARDIAGRPVFVIRARDGALRAFLNICRHRAARLVPEGAGHCDVLRSPYHGWLYDGKGDCVERPMEASPRAKFPRKTPAYPVQELGGMLFTYMGPLPAPALPRWDLYVWPNAIRQIAINVLNCNWLQCQENTGDPTHSVWTHGHFFKYVLERDGKFDERTASDKHTMHNRIKWGNGIKEITAQPTC